MNTSYLRRGALPAAAVLTLGLTLSACGNSGSGGSGGGDTVTGGGSTAQAVAEQTWRADYQNAHSGTTINYEEVGSGTGVTNFLSKAYSFAGSDAFLTSDQIASAKTTCGADAIEVPNYVSPLAIIYNLKGVDSLNLSGETAANIFNGSITKWNDPAIAKDNPGVTLPSTAITTVHRSDDSGTTFNFTDYLSQASNGAWTDPASVTWPTGSGGQGLEGDVRCGRRCDRHGRRHRLRGRQRRRRPRGGQRPGRLRLRAALGRGRVQDAFGLVPRDGAPGHRHGGQGQPYVDQEGDLPAASRLLPDGLPDLQRQQDR